jgi:hypothetical protein
MCENVCLGNNAQQGFCLCGFEKQRELLRMNSCRYLADTDVLPPLFSILQTHGTNFIHRRYKSAL